MTMLRETFQSHLALAVALSGFGLGALFGALSIVTNFCVMGAVSDWRLFGDKGRLGAVALATATALLGAQALHHAGAVDLSLSMYLAPRINWMGALLGGGLFGYGMVYAGGCASRNLVRAGAGDLRALVTLLALSVTALVTLSGVLGPLRNWVETTTALSVAVPSLADAASKLGLGEPAGRLVAVLIVAVPLLVFAFRGGGILSQPRNLAGGLGVGLVVVLGWLANGLAYDDMAVHPVLPTSLTFVKPVSDAVDWLERSTALGIPTFGAASVFGVLAGSLAAAILTGKPSLAAFADRSDFLRHLGGGILMGIGGILALGCSIGQGVTGVSTLSIQSVIAAAAILGGAAFGLRHLENNL